MNPYSPSAGHGAAPLYPDPLEDRVLLLLNPELIEPFNSIPVRPALCRWWRIKASIIFTGIVIVLAVIIGFLTRIYGWFGVPKQDPLVALYQHEIDMLFSIPLIAIIGPFVVYFLISRGLYRWLYEK